MVVPGRYKLTGHTQDISNGNVTPAVATIDVTHLFFEGNVATQKGSIHNNPCCGKWRKGFFGASQGSWEMSFEEVLPTNKGYFVYRGALNREGTKIVGTFSWSVFPSSPRGSFTFNVVAE